MQVIKADNFEAAKKAADIIQRGGSVVFPTDTVYGLAVDALRKDAIERLFKIKKRPETKPVPIMIKDLEMAKKLAFVDKNTEKFLKKIWPGPVTAVLRKRKVVCDLLSAGKDTVGLRIADCRVVKKIFQNLKCPITGTSANFSGQPPVSNSQDIINIFDREHPQPDLFLDAGNLPKASPSTVIDLTGSEPRVLRIGPVNKEELLKIFAKI